MRGRRSRVVLAPRRRAKVRETLDKRFAGDGGKKALSPGRARSKPLEPLRGQGRTISAEPVVLPRAFLLHVDHGCQPAPSLPCALLHVRVIRPQSAGAICARENAEP